MKCMICKNVLAKQLFKLNVTLHETTKKLELHSVFKKGFNHEEIHVLVLSQTSCCIKYYYPQLLNMSRASGPDILQIPMVCRELIAELFWNKNFGYPVWLQRHQTYL